ncbi:hypothetical protein DJ58_4453 [Yersinia frederiksenii ATCC 33641]|uniref:Uncharacterized protein n=1 Tax=Yersinia frederiksenii ATCC 33641 TaxID=349966 RepID=A0ABR4VY44_YERFR|nr:hypothetical protein DJ58_4453 [Yersinia frederiksenii ATCC 33641]
MQLIEQFDCPRINRGIEHAEFVFVNRKSLCTLA